ncbi:hypothetical protein ACLOJK_040059 [Asimina triloba]
MAGSFGWICEGGFTLGSLCTQRHVVDVLNVLFMFAFGFLQIVTCTRRRYINRNRTRDSVLVVASACCSITGIAYFTDGLWNFFKNNDEYSKWDSASYIFRGLNWVVVALSLRIQRTRSEGILISVWLAFFFISVSLLNLEVLLKKHTVPILDAIAWPVNLLLLFCSFRLASILALQHTHKQNSSEDSQPLITDQGNKINLKKISFISQIIFSWINPLLHLGYSKPLVIDDIPPLDLDDEASLAYQKFIQEWDLRRKQRSNTTNLVLRVLAHCYMKEMIAIGFLAFLRTCAVVAGPLLLFAFVQYSANQDASIFQGLFLVGCLVMIKIVESLSQRHWFFGARRYGMRMRSAVMVAIFQKLLRLSSVGRGIHSTGEIVNYIAVDAYRLGEFPWWFHTAWTLPLQLVLAICVLFGTVGLGVLPGLVPLIICTLVNVPFAKLLQNYRAQFMQAQDERLRATSEALNNMKVIKLQSWEEHFRNVIQTLRDTEFKWLAEAQIKKSYGTVLYWMSPIFVSSVVFLGCAVLGSAPLNASTFFTVLATLRVMSEPGKILPEALSVMIQVKVSLDRLDGYLLDDELKEEDVNRLPLQNSNFNIRIHKGVFSWNPNASAPTLRCINLEVSRGKKVAICGPVGAGKSSLLYALLGEIPKVSGSVDVFGSIAYVSQSSWIQSGTIRDNILFGKEMDEKRYKEAIRVCALDKDIDNFDHGDLTEIGQRGLNLSGGQKQRLQLARAVYNDADTYLLDDPFSAVDAHTAAILFNDCVMAALQNKTVILVTHQVEFLAEADQILVMEDGHITESGNYAELLEAGTAFEQLVSAHHDSMTGFDNAKMAWVGKAKKEDGDQPDSGQPASKKESSQGKIEGLSGQLTEDEEKETGNVGWKPYLDYLRVSNGSLLFASVIFSQSAFAIFQAASTYWLAIASRIPKISDGILIGVYAGVSTFSGLFVYLRVWFAAHLGLKASKAFFSGLMNSLFKAPMLFFDSTPIGRILTRASSDLSVVDFDIPYSIAFVATGLLDVVSIVVIMATVTWQVLIVAIPVIVIARYVQEYYLASARELIRINGTTKAPVMNYAAETSLGVVTIRAFNMSMRFFKNNLKLVDLDATLFFHINAAMEWVLMRVEVLQNLTIFAAALLLILLPRGTIAPVERIKQYMHIPSEPPAIIHEKRPPVSWPSEGRIDLQDLKVRYRPNAPLVLKGITCTFQAGNRVGVVGRTGSGKTTLISALFRLVEPESGKILIDGLDIFSMGLKDLRNELSVIPQDPALFRGSVRSNLDPLGLYSDHEIWETLRKRQREIKSSKAIPKLISIKGNADDVCHHVYSLSIFS